MSDKSLVIGNGESRLSFDLSAHIKKFYSYGCNAVYRDVVVDKLFCYDKRMAVEFLSNTADTDTILYTTDRYVNDLAKTYNTHTVRSFPELPYKGTSRPDQPQHWNSGQYALLSACYDDNTDIYILGFDLYSQTAKVNNVYKDTQNYSSSNSHAIDYSYWIYQNAKLFSIFRDKKFTIVNTEDWKMPNEWTFSNVGFVDAEKFSSKLHYS